MSDCQFCAAVYSLSVCTKICKISVHHFPTLITGTIHELLKHNSECSKKAKFEKKKEGVEGPGQDSIQNQR